MTSVEEIQGEVQAAIYVNTLCPSLKDMNDYAEYGRIWEVNLTLWDEYTALTFGSGTDPQLKSVHHKPFQYAIRRHITSHPSL